MNKWLVMVLPHVCISSCGYRCNLVNSLSPTVYWDMLWRAETSTKFCVSTKLNCNVGLLRLFPGITTETVSQPGRRGDGGR